MCTTGTAGGQYAALWYSLLVVEWAYSSPPNFTFLFLPLGSLANHLHSETPSLYRIVIRRPWPTESKALNRSSSAFLLLYLQEGCCSTVVFADATLCFGQGIAVLAKVRSCSTKFFETSSRRYANRWLLKACLVQCILLLFRIGVIVAIFHSANTCAVKSEVLTGTKRWTILKVIPSTPLVLNFI